MPSNLAAGRERRSVYARVQSTASLPRMDVERRRRGRNERHQERVASPVFPVPPIRHPRPEPPPDTIPFDQTPREDGLSVDFSLESYGRKRWRPSRWNPFRSRWAEVAEYDARVARLDERQADVSSQLAALHEQFAVQEKADRTALSLWVEDPSGERPLPVAPGIAQRIRKLEAEYDALTLAIQSVLDQKTEYVVQRRGRLSQEAAKARAEAVRELDSAIATVEEARAQAVAAVEAERWAAEFPGPDADAGALRLAMIKGGRVVKALPEFDGQIAAVQAVEILREDSDWLDRAVPAEQEQKAARLTFARRQSGRTRPRARLPSTASAAGSSKGLVQSTLRGGLAGMTAAR